MRKQLIIALISALSATSVSAKAFTNFEEQVFRQNPASVPLQLRELSEQEMKDTEGEVIWFAPAIAAGARFALVGFTRHGLNQAISRQGVGVASKSILHTMRNPTRIRYQSGGRVRFDSKQGGVVLNSQGRIITTWGQPRYRRFR